MTNPTEKQVSSPRPDGPNRSHVFTSRAHNGTHGFAFLEYAADGYMICRRSDGFKCLVPPQNWARWTGGAA